MKRILDFLLLCVLLTMLPACGGSDTPESPNSHRGNARRYTVDLSLGGDFIEESERPLTRAGESETASPTYVGIYVRTKKTPTDSWQYYAYGLFDDQSKMQLELAVGYYYEFHATTLSSSTDIYEMERNGSERQMDRPFVCDREDGAQNVAFNANNMNKFIYSDVARFRYLNLGTAHVKIPGTSTPQYYRFPRVHRYYGKMDGFLFTSDMKNIEIPVQKKNFGIQIKTVGLPEGTTLSWRHSNPGTSSTSEGSAQLRFSTNSFSGSDVEQQSWEDVYSLYYLDKETTTTFDIEFTWQRSPSVSEKHTISFTPTPNVMKVLKIDFTKQTSAEGVNISIKQEETEMTAEEEEHLWE